MIARKLTLTFVVSVCALVGALALGVTPVFAVARFGSFGEESGQINESQGIALDHSGDVYISDEHNLRIDRFTGSGEFDLAWGWGVASGANELQTCAISCRGGLEGSGAGEFYGEGPRGVAVDSEPGSSYGDVYVVDVEGYRVEKFGPSGEFLLMFGGDVNEKSTGKICLVGEACKDGTQGLTAGEFEWGYKGSYIAVGPGGRVYVGDRGRIQVFEPSGIWRESISLAGLSSNGQVSALAVNAVGDMFLKDEGITGVRELEPDGVEKSTQFDAGSESVQGIALGASGDVFVSDTRGTPHFIKYDSSGKELASFGATTLTSIGAGVAYSEALGELYIYGIKSAGESSESGVWVFPVPGPGPVIESESGTLGLRGGASLEGQIDPEGNKTSYRFEYVDEVDYQATGYADASSTPSGSLEAGFEDQSISAQLTGLIPGETYHYRLVATNSQGTVSGQDQSLEETSAALIEGPWVTNVASTSATFAVKIDPLGVDTEYRLEYGTSTSYGHVLASGDLGEGESYVTITRHIQELEPDTIYHYRVVTISMFGTVESIDHTFTTQIAGGQELTLSDSRAWELVSPANKKGALIDPRLYGGQESIQAASDGSAMSYTVSLPLGENPIGNSAPSQVFSMRDADGWHSEDVSIPVSQRGNEDGPEYRVFSSDLTSAIVEPSEDPEVVVQLSAEATERTPYLRNDTNDTFLPLVTPANVPPGTKFGFSDGENTFGEGKSIVPEPITELKFLVATPDLSHIILRSPFALTPGAINGCPTQNCISKDNLYEWSKGQLQLVNVLPDGSPAPEGLLGVNNYVVEHAVSSDGRRIVWQGEGGEIGPSSGGHVTPIGLYVRDMIEKKTVRIGGAHPLFETMSSDGSKIFFVEKGVAYENGELYVYDWNTGIITDVTKNHNSSEENAGVQNGVIGTSENGSYVYFVATGDLAEGAVSGEDNLYVSHEDGGSWTTTFIAALSHEDEQDWYSAGENRAENRANVSSHVSPDGRYMTFMSNRSLTNYDNRDAISGQLDEEVYLYNSETDKLVCASCDPTGVRSIGVHAKDLSVLMEADGGWNEHWLAASIPGWHGGASEERVTQEPHVVFDSGRLFFDSAGPLVPQDTDGLADAYEYEPAGVGSCASTSSTFNEHTDGCVSLISSGTSSGESLFYDASETGDDVFFITSAKLVTEDYDTAYDMYDAHVCSTAVPCRVVHVSPPPCTSGDSCKAAPSPQPEIFGAPPSATFSGVGNVAPATSKPVLSSKSLTRAQKLARALTECHKKKDKKKRGVCELQARKRYAAKRSGKAKMTKRGER